MDIDALSALGWKPFFQSQITLDDWDSRIPLRVTEVHRTRLEAIGADGEHTVHLPTHERWSERVTVGDWLLARAEGHELYVDRLLERDNGIRRIAAGTETAEQWIAANLDAVLIVLAADETFSLNRLERYLAVLLEQRVAPVIVVTKADLYPDAAAKLARIDHPYPKILLDTREAQHCADLQPFLGRGSTIALIGTSGVGKTTLTNALLGRNALATQAVREGDQRGRHTTTARHLLQLPSGGLIIDTPGMRGFRLPGGDAGLQRLFADIHALAQQCRFGDCDHLAEPGCAVRAALADGSLEARRYDNYRKMLREQAFNEREQRARHEVKAAQRKFGAKVRASARFKQWRRDVGGGDKH